jgi:hypothetical protein
MASIRSTSLPFNSRDGGLTVGLLPAPTPPGRPMNAAAATSATPALRVELSTTADMPGGQATPPCASDGADAPKRRVQDRADIVARALLREFYQHVAEHGGDRVGDLLTHTAGVLRDELKAAQQDMLNEIRLCDE